MAARMAWWCGDGGEQWCGGRRAVERSTLVEARACVWPCPSGQPRHEGSLPAADGRRPRHLHPATSRPTWPGPHSAARRGQGGALRPGAALHPGVRRHARSKPVAAQPPRRIRSRLRTPTPPSHPHPLSCLPMTNQSQQNSDNSFAFAKSRQIFEDPDQPAGARPSQSPCSRRGRRSRRWGSLAPIRRHPSRPHQAWRGWENHRTSGGGTQRVLIAVVEATALQAQAARAGE